MLDATGAYVHYICYGQSRTTDGHLARMDGESLPAAIIHCRSQFMVANRLIRGSALEASFMDIQESLSQILASKDEFGKLFYHEFLTRHPEVRRYFESVDMKRQGVQLTTAMMIIERYSATPTPAVELYLQYLGTKHHDLGIAREDYPKWVATMCDVLKRFHGDQWDSQLESLWREAFERTIELMFQGYEQHVSV